MPDWVRISPICFARSGCANCRGVMFRLMVSGGVQFSDEARNEPFLKMGLLAALLMRG